MRFLASAALSTPLRGKDNLRHVAPRGSGAHEDGMAYMKGPFRFSRRSSKKKKKKQKEDNNKIQLPFECRRNEWHSACHSKTRSTGGTNCSVEDRSVQNHVNTFDTSARTPARGLEAVTTPAKFGWRRRNAPGASACDTSETLCSSYGK